MLVVFFYSMLSLRSLNIDSSISGRRWRRMQNKQQQFGERSETLAAWYLKKNGYTIIEQNYRNQLGEIDIIAREKKTIVFVEVKSRRSTRYGSPKWAVTPKKQRKISMVALYYLKTTKQSNAKARFDVVSIYANQDEPQIEIVKNAFDLAY
jgi:putative endonuclease